MNITPTAHLCTVANTYVGFTLPDDFGPDAPPLMIGSEVSLFLMVLKNFFSQILLQCEVWSECILLQICSEACQLCTDNIISNRNTEDEDCAVRCGNYWKPNRSGRAHKFTTIQLVLQHVLLIFFVLVHKNKLLFIVDSVAEARL